MSRSSHIGGHRLEHVKKGRWARISIVLAVAVVGAIVLVSTHAASPAAQIEAELGNRPANVTQINSANASTGKAVRFNAPAATANGKFYIVGGQIVGPDGKIFLPMGANGAVSPGYTFNWNGVLNGHVADVKNWGWNIVRATVVCANGNGTNDLNGLYAGLDSLVAEYTAQHVVVMLECHDFTGQNPTDVSSLYSYWDRMLTVHGSNPYVWFNPVNEPYTGTSSAELTNWLALQNNLYARVRAKAPNNIFVADIPGYGQGVSAFKGSETITRLGAGKCNVLYSWHDYGAVSEDYNVNNNEATNTQAQIDMYTYIHDNNIPVVMGELGDPLTLNEGTAGSPSWNRWGAYAAMNYATQKGIGLMWWHATGDSGVFLTYSLMADRHQAPWSAYPAGSGTSAGGLKFWNVSHSQPAPATFAGNLADSHCAL